MRYALWKPRFSTFIVSLCSRFTLNYGAQYTIWYYYSLLSNQTPGVRTTLGPSCTRGPPIGEWNIIKKHSSTKKALLFVFFLQHRPLAGTAKAETAADLRLGKNHRPTPVPADVAVHAQQLRLSDIPGCLRARQRVAVRDQDLSISQFQRLYDSRSSLR